VRRGLLALLLVVGLAGCADDPALIACAPNAVPQGDVVYVVKHGWHTDLAIPSDVLRGDMVVFRQIFPGVRVLVLGFGKRTFMMSPVTSIQDLVIGPLPGDGAILVTGLTAPPDQAYDDGVESVIHLPPGGAERLSDFVWRTLRVKDGMPVRLGDGFFPGSVFYATRTGYSGFFTCNTWAADGLHAAGLKMDGDGVVFSGQVMARAAPLSGALCAIKGNP
jgi:Protein of unknown function (DUF2459)